MRIVYLLAPAAVGGLERVVQALALGQAKRGHDVVVAAITEQPLSREHPFCAPLNGKAIRIVDVVVPPRRYRQERRRIAELCRELAPDVVHSHGNRPDVVDGPVVRAIGIAHVSTHHGWTFGSLRNRLYEYLHTRALRHADAVIAVSDPIARRLIAEGVDADRVHVVRNGFVAVTDGVSRVDARRELGLPSDGRVAGWVGRLSREKGVDVFVEAMARLRESGVIGCVIGDGSERSAEAANAERLGASIVWKGMVPAASRLLSAFDVFVQSSRTEGTPIALLEAMAAEVPIVATSVGGVPDVVSENEAVLVSSEDPAALGAAMLSVFTDPAAAALRAGSARDRLKSEFGADVWLDRHEEIYRLAMTRRRSAM